MARPRINLSQLKEKKKKKEKRRKNSGVEKRLALDLKDRLILNEIQRNFPITHRPYLALARKLKLKEKEILVRVKKMHAAGIIRRIGASFSARAVGFTSTLCAAKVPAGKIEKFIAVVNSYPGVTHNYERKAIYNIWFTLIAPSAQKIQKIINEISARTGIKEILNLPASKIIKIAVDFNFE